jgi:hypothetical protein
LLSSGWLVGRPTQPDVGFSFTILPQTKALAEIVLELCKEHEIGEDPVTLALKVKIPMKARPTQGSPTKAGAEAGAERSVYLTERVRMPVCVF